MSLKKTMKNQQGFTITELMVGMFLSLVVMAGVLSVYSSNKSNYRSQEGLSRIQDGYRFATDVIQKDLRLAGYYGCNKETPLHNVLNSLPFVANYTRPIEGFNASSMTAWDRTISATGLSLGTADGDEVRGGTDILVVRRAANQQFPVDLAMSTNSSDVVIRGSILVDDVLIISDCYQSTLFQATAWDAVARSISHATSGGSIGNSTTEIVKPTESPFNLDANVMQLQTVIYFIGTSANGTPSLKRKINNNNSETIISGAENMQVVYGLDTDADGVSNRYVNASNITTSQWDSVTSARISLLVSTPENLLEASDTEQYQMLDETIKNTGSTITHAGDLKFRQVVNMTVDVRNI